MTDKQLEEQQEVRRITPEQRDLWIKKAKESAALKKAAAAKLEAEQAAGLKK